MRKIFYLAFVFFLASCASLKKTPSTEMAAEKAFASKQYEKAMPLWVQLISEQESQGTNKTSKAYEKAGQTALALKDTLKSESYFKLAVYYQTASPSTYQFLAKYYRQQGNLSREVMALEGLVNQYPESKEAKVEKVNLFQLYVQTGQLENASDLWTMIPVEDQNEAVLDSWFSVNQSLKNDLNCDTIADVLLGLNAENINGLEWNAKKYYNKGEDRYQQELEAYEKNKTNRQYNILLKGLEVSTADFKKSLDYFLQLIRIKPESDYALYISNIYARFGDEANSARFRSLMNQKR